MEYEWWADFKHSQTIYALINPETNEPYYVGRTGQLRLQERLGQHIYQKHHPTTKMLSEKGIKPEIIELEYIEDKDMSKIENLERYWIAQMSCWGFRMENVKKTQ